MPILCLEPFSSSPAQGRPTGHGPAKCEGHGLTGTRSHRGVSAAHTGPCPRSTNILWRKHKKPRPLKADSRAINAVCPPPPGARAPKAQLTSHELLVLPLTPPALPQHSRRKGDDSAAACVPTRAARAAGRVGNRVEPAPVLRCSVAPFRHARSAAPRAGLPPPLPPDSQRSRGAILWEVGPRQAVRVCAGGGLAAGSWGKRNAGVDSESR